MSKIGEIHIFGQASNRMLKVLEVEREDADLSLLDFLFRSKIPLASSCSGEGVCLKCKVNNNDKIIISCQIKMSELLQNERIQVIRISYL